MQVLEQSSARLVLQSRNKVFRALGTVLLLVPAMGVVTLAHSAIRWLEHPELQARQLPLAMLCIFVGLFVAGSLLLVYGPYRVTHIFDRDRHAYVKESTSVRRTRRVEYPLATFCSVEVQEEDEGGCRVVLVNDAGKKLPLGDPSSSPREQADAVADLVESFLTTA
jgi:hypothetical protein